MSTNETLVEEFCYLCGTLIAISGFKNKERRNRDILYLCMFCAQGDGSQFKRPKEDELIHASILVREGGAPKEAVTMVEKYGLVDEESPRYQVLLHYREAGKKQASGDIKGSNQELMSLVKLIARI